MIKQLLAVTGAVLLTACASSSQGTKPSASPAPAPLPDARDLSEHPLDVLGLPQP